MRFKKSIGFVGKINIPEEEGCVHILGFWELMKQGEIKGGGLGKGQIKI